MKKFLYKLPIWATCFCVLLCTVLSINIQPSFASSADASPFPFAAVDQQSSPEYTVAHTIDDDFVTAYDASYSSDLFIFYLGSIVDGSYSPILLPPGSYSVFGSISPGQFPQTAMEVCLIKVTDDAEIPCFYSFGETFTVPSEGQYGLIVQSFSEPILTRVEASTPLYYSAYQMFADFIYGEGAQLTAEQNMTLTILATLAALFVVLFPFLIVFLVVRFITWLR